MSDLLNKKIWLHVYSNPSMDSHCLWGAIQALYSDAHTWCWGTVSCLPPLPISHHFPKYVPDFITTDSSQLSCVMPLLLRLYFLLEASSEPLLYVASSSHSSCIPSLLTTWHCSCTVSFCRAGTRTWPTFISILTIGFLVHSRCLINFVQWPCEWMPETFWWHVHAVTLNSPLILSEVVS